MATNSQIITESTNEPQDIIVHAYDWKVVDEFDEEGKLAIFGWCLDRDSKPYLLRFHDFPAYCMVELPLYVNNKKMQWSDYKARLVYESICWYLKEDAPFKFFAKRSEKLYFYRGRKKYPMLVLLFNSLNAMRHCFYKLKYPIKVKGIGRIACKVWEHKISPVRKLLTLRDVKYSQWFRIKGKKITGDAKISHVENEFIADRNTMFPISDDECSGWVTEPTILAYDIETYSDNHKALPDPLCSRHICYLISIVYQRLNHPETKETTILLVGDCYDIEDVNIIRCKSEMELIKEFSRLVQHYDPEVITGYNIFGYDWPYLDTRLKRRLMEWSNLGRIIGEDSKMVNFSWGSSAYGQNSINFLDMAGRVNLDLYPIIKRDYKLSLYKLDYVANYFLKRGKLPVTAQDMFRAYEAQLKAAKTGEPDDKKRAMDEMTQVVKYCVIDSDLVICLMDKLHCWISLIETSSVMGVTPVELFTRGQQVRALSQIYNEAAKENIVIDQRSIPKMNYSGGFVYQPIPGIYHYIPCLDFKSLYPTVMISHNIDHRTFVPPELMDKIPDCQCHVIEWEEEADNDKENDDDDDSNDNTKMVQFRYKFVRKEVLEGIMPRLLTRLIAERDSIRKVQKKYKKGTIEWIVLEQKQLSCKYSTNSFYGILGAQTGGVLPLPEAAAAVTAKSRESIMKVNEYLEARGHKIVYGDSVTGDTPLLLRDAMGQRWTTINNFFRASKFVGSHGHGENAKEYADAYGDIEVWSDQGWTRVNHLMRHKTNKRIFRITTAGGLVKVTEDHSLLNLDGKEVRPKDVKVSDNLLHKELPKNDDLDYKDEKVFKTKDPVQAAKYFQYRSANLSCYFIPRVYFKDGYYIITSSYYQDVISETAIVEIEDLGVIDDWVYDLETENHHFAAGVGELVVHNTDSSMPDIGITDPNEAYPMAAKIGVELTKLFPPPMVVEDEDVYHTMLCIKKKMYLCIVLGRDGKPILETDSQGNPIPGREKIKSKGVTTARRDNCPYKRECFSSVARNVLKRKPMMETYNMIIEMCLKLMRREIPWQELVAVKGLNSHYKNKSYCMKIFSDELSRIGKPAKPGERLEYIIVNSLGIKETQLLGYKMRTPETFLERAGSEQPEHIDYLYYMEKSLMNCIEKQLWQIGYMKELAELEEKYVQMDYQLVMQKLRDQGYSFQVDTAIEKFEGDLKAVVDFFIEETKLKTRVMKLRSKYIRWYRRIQTRVHKNPIKMMVKIIQQKQRCMDEIKTIENINSVLTNGKINNNGPIKRKIQLTINPRRKIQIKGFDRTQWIKTKTKEMQALSHKD